MSEQLNNLLIDTVGEVTVVRFVGLSAMDLPAAESLLDVVARLPTPPRVALDFGHLLRLDRAVVEKLTHLRRRIQADGGVLTLHPLNPELLDLIRRTLGFLQTQHVRFLGSEEFEKVLLQHGAQAVDVPGNEFHKEEEVQPGGHVILRPPRM